jgi:Flp pilus assembly protein TadG
MNDTAILRANRNSERGGAMIKTALAVLILGSMVFAGFKVVPAYLNNYELQDSMSEAARFALANRQTSDDLQNEMFKKVQDLGIDVKKEDIHVQVLDPPQALVQISISYSVPIDLQVYQFDLQFHPHADNRSI